MARRRIERDNLGRVSKVYAYYLGDTDQPTQILEISYVGDSDEAQKLSFWAKAEINRQEDGSYVYTYDGQGERKVVDLYISQRRGIATFRYDNVFDREEIHEITYEDTPSGNTQGYQAFMILVFLFCMPPLGFLFLILFVLELKIRKIRRKRRLLMDKIWNFFHKSRR